MVEIDNCKKQLSIVTIDSKKLRKKLRKIKNESSKGEKRKKIVRGDG